ncbi:hypothetical protein [Kribbella sp. NPDC051718]|uniref:hypothetical protein n=1 Tax=Kribbella sp. NPDC051718 TaxID=3155168 RepID=UPI0034232187
MKRKHWVTRLGAMIGAGAVLGGGLILPLQAQAAAPPFTGCKVIDDYLQYDFAQDGRWLNTFIKYKCNNGEPYSFEANIIRVSDGSSVAFGGHGGVDTEPYAIVQSRFCKGSVNTVYKAVWSLQIDGTTKTYTTPKRTLPCSF